MCVATPMRIIELNGSEAKVELGGVTRMISISLLESALVGDYVLIHAGFAIGKLNEAEAMLTLKELAECGLDREAVPNDDGYAALGA